MALGYIAFGIRTMALFTFGFLGGLLLYVFVPSRASFSAIKAPFFYRAGVGRGSQGPGVRLQLLLDAFYYNAIMAAQELIFAFGLSWLSPTPDIGSWEVILLVALSVGGWLSVPYLVTRRAPFGYYLAWTFFAAMGMAELAHIFVFPILIGKPFEYFPWMATMFLLAPVAWWGMRRMSRKAANSLVGL